MRAVIQQRRQRSPWIASALAVALGVGSLLVAPDVANACGAAKTGTFTGTTSCADSSSGSKKRSKSTRSSGVGGGGGGSNNPVGSFRLPTTKEYRTAIKSGFKKAGGDQPSAKDLDRLAKSPESAFCVGNAAYRWSGSGFSSSNSCWIVNRPTAGGEPGVVVQQISPEEAARSVIARLNFTAAAPGIGPDHDDNHLADDVTNAPFDIPVGYPIWLYADGGTIEPRTVTESAGGMSVRISIKVDKITWSTGDGHTKTCGVGTKWRKGAVEPATPSPTCGYVYEKKKKYTVTATTHWTINWAAGGQTGTIPFAIGRDRPYRVGELQTIIR